jgi:lysophospholipase L1-like esterase
MKSLTRRVGIALAGAALAGIALAAGLTSTTDASAGPPDTFVAAWGTSEQLPSDGFEPNWSRTGFSHQSVREVVRLTASGSSLRVRLSNVYGIGPLPVTGATVALTASGASVVPGSVRMLTFGGSPATVIPAGAELRSDPVALPVTEPRSVTVTLYFDATTGPATFHAIANATTYAAAGNHLTDTGATAFTSTTHSWYYLSGVEVAAAPDQRDVVVAFGDSITDGYGATLDANSRYPDALADRLVAMGKPQPVLDEGIGGNLVCNDTAWFGARGPGRFARDVLDDPGVRTVILLEGVNDIGYSETDNPVYKPDPQVSSEQIIAGYQDIIRQAHAHGVRVIGGTLLPMKGSDHYSAASEAERERINDWIPRSGQFDGVADFATALATPGDPQTLNPAYAQSDHLHPNDAGYRLMADVINVTEL